MSESLGRTGYDAADRHAESSFQRSLWDAAESALEAITPALWEMVLTAGTLDLKPDTKLRRLEVSLRNRCEWRDELATPT